MKFKQSIFIAFVLFLSASFVFAQRPPRGNGPPRQPGQIGQPRMPRGEKPPMGDRDGNAATVILFKRFDTNKNQKIEFEEFQAAADSAFKALDKDGNGVVDENERRPKPEGIRPESNEIPQFLFFERDSANLSRAAFRSKILDRDLTILIKIQMALSTARSLTK